VKQNRARSDGGGREVAPPGSAAAADDGARLGVHARGPRTRRDAHGELARRHSIAGEHGLRTGAQAGGDAVVNRCVPGCAGVTRQTKRLVSPPRSGPSAHVFVYAVVLPVGARSTTNTGRWASASPACSLRAENESTVTATSGRVFTPVLRTAMTSRGGRASRWRGRECRPA
jgi:hypothetical protein